MCRLHMLNCVSLYKLSMNLFRLVSNFSTSIVRHKNDVYLNSEYRSGDIQFRLGIFKVRIEHGTLTN